MARARRHDAMQVALERWQEMHGAWMAGDAWSSDGRGCMELGWQGMRGARMAGDAWSSEGRGCMERGWQGMRGAQMQDARGAWTGQGPPRLCVPLML